MPHPLDDALLSRVQTAIDDQIAAGEADLAELGADTAPLVHAIRDLLAGGKRLRAAFCYHGHLAAGGTGGDALVRMSAAMEIFQAAALIHDDVMDHSDTRRGLPATHRRIERLHREHGLAGDAAAFGEAGAILAGDLCLTWSDALFAGSGLPASPATARARRIFDLMRTQLMGGQYLDVLDAATDHSALTTDERVARALVVIRFKSARYSVEHPLLIGAAAAGADEQTLGVLSRYGAGVGEAFQLRDDLLGVFGDPGTTGKPAGDDLVEGKQTVLLALALDGLRARGDETARLLVESRTGDPSLSTEEISRLQEAIQASGAVERVEELIARGRDDALMALEQAGGLTSAGRSALVDLAHLATARRA